MSLKKVTLLGSNLASGTDLKRSETPHSLCCDFGGYKTFTIRWSGGTVQVWVQVQAHASHLAISQKAVPEGNRRFRGQNQLPTCAKLLGQLCGSACAGWTGEHKHKAFPNQWQSLWLRPAICLLKENMLPLLRYWLSLSSRANKVLILCNFRAATSHFFFFMWNENSIE